MPTVDGLISAAAAWAAAAVAGYLALGLVAAAVAHRRASAGVWAERMLLLYPRLVRAALRTLAVTTLGLGAAVPATAAYASQPSHGGPRPPVVAPARPRAEPLDWPVADASSPQPAGPVARHRPPQARLTVRSGDNLWSLAAHALGPEATQGQVAAAWPRWWSANREVIGADPDLLRPGLRLRVPTLSERSAS